MPSSRGSPPPRDHISCIAGRFFTAEPWGKPRDRLWIKTIFQKLYQQSYPIEKMVLVDTYDADDNASMADNNTSSFNYRVVEGTTHLSKHSLGLAIDINPRYNPYIHTLNGQTVCSPENGSDYADRSKDFPYKIDTEDYAYKLFLEYGFSWGGNWNSSKDYQHFEVDTE